MTSYLIPTDKTLPANQFIRMMLAANGGNYPAFIKAEHGEILKKQYDATGTPEYVGVYLTELHRTPAQRPYWPRTQ